MRKRPLSREEIARAYSGEGKQSIPQILCPKQLALLVGVSPRTIYVWIAQGRLDGSFRKRGNHVLIWRDRAIDILFNGPNWSNGKKD